MKIGQLNVPNRYHKKHGTKLDVSIFSKKNDAGLHRTWVYIPCRSTSLFSVPYDKYDNHSLLRMAVNQLNIEECSRVPADESYLGEHWTIDKSEG